MARPRIALLSSAVAFLLAMIGGAIVVSGYVASETERRARAIAEDLHRQVSEDIPNALADLALRADGFGPRARFWVPITELGDDVHDLSYVEIYTVDAATISLNLTTVASLIELRSLDAWQQRTSDDLLLPFLRRQGMKILAQEDDTAIVHVMWFEPDQRSTKIRIHVQGSVRTHGAAPRIFHASRPFSAPTGVLLHARCDVVGGEILEADIPRIPDHSRVGSDDDWYSHEFLRPTQLDVALPKDDDTPLLLIKIPRAGPPAGVVSVWTLAVLLSLVGLGLFVVRGRDDPPA